MEAGLALVASALFNALFISMRMQLLGKPFEKIVEILEAIAFNFSLAQIGKNNLTKHDRTKVTGSLDISVLAYVLEKMSTLVDSSAPSKAAPR